jgi:hypothetical protein
MKMANIRIRNYLIKHIIEKLIIAVLCISLIGCSPRLVLVNETDGVIIVELKRSFVRSRAKKPQLKVTPGSSGGNWNFASGCNSGEAAVVIVAVVVVVVVVVAAAAAIERIGRNLQGTTVYAYPVGYPHYRQRLKWGKNKIAVPHALKHRMFDLHVEMKGSYEGHGTIRVVPPVPDPLPVEDK